MSIKDEIDRTEAQIANHRAAISKLETHGKALALKSLGLEIGDRIICSPWRGKEFEAEVIGVRRWDAATLVPDAMKVRKDGTVGQHSAGYVTSWRKK